MWQLTGRLLMDEAGEREGGSGTTAPPTPTPEEPPAWAKPLIQTQQAIAETLSNLSSLLPQVNPSPTTDNPQPVAQTPEPAPEPQPQSNPSPVESAGDPPAKKERRGLFSQGIKVRW